MGAKMGMDPVHEQGKPKTDAPAAGHVSVEISKDRLTAYLLVHPPEPGGRALSSADALQALAAAGVSFGVDSAAVTAAVAEAARAGQSVRRIVARGRPPEPGADARIEHHAALLRAGGQPRQRQDGSVDYFDLGLVQNIEVGTVLAKKIPATKGRPGLTVTGTEVPPRPGRDLPLLAGEGAQLQADGLQVVAAETGHALLQSGRVQVSRVFAVRGHVGPSTGNIDFAGSVVVRGNIAAGYSIKASHDVEVQGGIESGSVEAGGNVVVQYGIRGGGGKGSVRAGGAVQARFVENADVHSGGDVLVRDAILHSRVRSGGRVLMTGRKASIIGGHVTARQEVVTRVIGSSWATVTEVEVGVSPGVREEVLRLKEQLAACRQNLTRAAQAVSLLGNQDKAGNLSAERREMLLRATRSQSALQAEQAELAQRLLVLEQELAEAGAGRVEAADAVYPGVRITVGRLTYLVEDLQRRVRFCRGDSGEISAVPLI